MTASLTEIAYRHVRARLLENLFDQDAVRLSEPSLAKEIGISRTPVREAMKQLVREGLVEQVHGKGTFVRMPSREDLGNLLEVRETMEAAAAELAAERRTDEDLREMRRILKRIIEVSKRIRSSPPYRSALQGSELGREEFGLDHAFHFRVVRAAKNPYFEKILENHGIIVRAMMLGQTRPARNLVYELGASARDHAAIFRAIKEGDPAAARQAMMRHVRRATRNTLDLTDEAVEKAKN